VRPLRVGYDGKVKSSLLEHTLDSKLEKHPLKHEVDELSKTEENLRKRASDLRDKLDDWSNDDIRRTKRAHVTLIGIEKQQGAVRSKLYAIRQRMLKDVIHGADVVCPPKSLHQSCSSNWPQICTTCITSACVALNVIDFPVVFLDEASMSTEPASLIPIMKGVCGVHILPPSN
jgi:superfamily I DNA and/or RNA helicase